MNREHTALTAIIAALFLIIVLGNSGMMGFGGYGMMRYSGLNSWGFLFMSLIGMLVIVALVLFIFWLWKELAETHSPSSHHERRRQ